MPMDPLKKLQIEQSELKRDLDAILKETRTFIAKVGAAMGIEVEGEPVVTEYEDQLWVCEKCHYRLGLYDHDEDVIRLRYKDQFTYVRIGVGGFITQICRQCGHANRMDYVSPDELAVLKEEEPTGQVPGVTATSRVSSPG